MQGMFLQMFKENSKDDPNDEGKKEMQNSNPVHHLQWGSPRGGRLDATVMGQLGGAPDNVPEVAAAGLTASCGVGRNQSYSC